jgi:hypothetical protein
MTSVDPEEKKCSKKNATDPCAPRSNEDVYNFPFVLPHFFSYFVDVPMISRVVRLTTQGRLMKIFEIQFAKGFSGPARRVFVVV